MLFNTYLSWFFSFFLISDLCFSIPAVATQIFDATAEIDIPIGTPTKDAKPDMETHPVTVQKLTKISAQCNSKLYKLFYASYSLIHFDLFLQ